MTDERIIEIKKESAGGRFGQPKDFTPWSETLRFARAIIEETKREVRKHE
jgi:hypothetical protein